MPRPAKNTNRLSMALDKSWRVTLTWPGFALVAVGAAAELHAMVYSLVPLPEGHQSLSLHQ